MLVVSGEHTLPSLSSSVHMRGEGTDLPDSSPSLTPLQESPCDLGDGEQWRDFSWSCSAPLPLCLGEGSALSQRQGCDRSTRCTLLFSIGKTRVPHASVFHPSPCSFLKMMRGSHLPYFVMDVDLFRIQERGRGDICSDIPTHQLFVLFYQSGSPLSSAFPFSTFCSLCGLLQQVPLLPGFPLDLAAGELLQAMGGKEENDVREFIS